MIGPGRKRGESEFAVEKKTVRRHRLVTYLSANLLGLAAVLITSQFGMDSLKGLLVDFLFRTQWWSEAHPDIVLIGYDDGSSRRYADPTKLPAEEVALISQALVAEKPKAVILVGPVNEKNYSELELLVIAESLRRLPHPFVAYTDDESLGKPMPSALAGSVRYLPGFISKDAFSYGADNVSRRVMIHIDGLPTTYAKVATLFGTPKINNGRFHFKNAFSFGKLTPSLQTYIRWQGKPGTYKPVSSEAVATSQFPPGTFSGKIVLIGSTLHSKKGADHVFTPYSRDTHGTFALEGAAHGLGTLLRNNGLRKSPPWLDFLLSLAMVLITVNLVLVLPPGRSVGVVLAEISLLLVCGWLLLFYGSFWLTLAHPLTATCVGYYLVIPYRLLDEYRKRWHYQEQSELMSELEQLKSNFLSLISHDLKTPIARIQGNAELMLSDRPLLTDRQIKSLEGIVQTTEDLSEYVETVLDLARVENARVPLTKTTKDINATLREVVQSKAFLAAEKNITIDLSLEPIFSFKFDVKLIRRVLSNLLENAIKYSPPNTRIVLHSREEGSWIKVSIADEGIGIPSEEQARVFQKFYRCDNEVTRQAKGTGLGLYLAKYFVELHKGVIDLKSELGKGTVFTVALPV